MDKAAIRKEVLGNLKALRTTAVLKKAQEMDLHEKLFASSLWQQASVVGLTLSSELELDTEPIIQRAWQEGKVVAVPKVLPARKMAFIKINSGTKYEESSFGIKEPINNDIINKYEIELLIVPGVAFQANGYRIGFGGGYYDRYLVDYPGATCSLVLPAQLGFTWEIPDHDLPVTTLFTL